MVAVERCRSGRWLHGDWGYGLGVVRAREEREKREIKARLRFLVHMPRVISKLSLV
jgi:hypothetical protein